MKKLLLNLALASVATSAFGLGVQIEPFSWSNQVVGPTPTIVAVVAGFNPALGVLTAVSVSLTGTAIVGSASVLNTEAYSTTATINLFGIHTTSINAVNIINGPIAIASPGVLIGPGGNAVVGPIQFPLGGTLPGIVPDAWAPGPHNVLIAFAGAFGVTTDPQAKVTSDPDLRSTGVGTITYTYDVPEAETYVAGLALLGMVGYGFYRRNRQA